jgi:hypothetical protein
MMETFIELQFIQCDTSIRINLDYYYIEVLLEEYQKFNARVLHGKQTPVQSGSKNDSPAVPDPKKQLIYRSLLAKLQFAATWIRYDIAQHDAAVAQLGRFCASSRPTHWAALRHLTCCLRKHTKFQLQYPKNSWSPTGLDGCCDSARGCANHESSRSTTGNLLRNSGCPISWKSKLETTISLSTAEAEYYSSSIATTEAIWLCGLIRALGFLPPGPTRCLRTTPLASSGVTMSLADAKVQSTLTSASIVHLRRSNLDLFDWCGWLMLINLQMLPPLQHRACISAI